MSTYLHTTTDGLTYRLHPGHYIDDGVKGQYFEPHVGAGIRAFVNSNTNCVDVGANFGFHSCLMAKLGKHVTCFEPMPIKDRIAENMALNNLTNYVIIDAVLGNQHLDSVDANFEFEWKKDEENKTIRTVKMERLDSLLNEEIGYLKIDVDGSEGAVVSGALKTIRRCMPVIQQEFGIYAREFNNNTWTPLAFGSNREIAKEIFQIYTDLGYIGIHFNETGPRQINFDTIVNIMFEAENPPSSVDVLFVPPSKQSNLKL